MASIVAVRSWRGGTGKSTVACRLSRELAGRGLRVALLDASLQAPGLHEAVGIDESQLRLGLSDYLLGKCEIEDVRHDATHLVPTGGPGRLYLVPATTDTGNIALPAFGRYDPGLLHDGFHRLIAVLDLDVLLVDTHAGVNYEALYAIAAADIDILVGRPTLTEQRGIRTAAAFAAQIGHTTSLLVLNMVRPGEDPAALRRRIEADCGVPVAAVLPHIAEFVPTAARPGGCPLATAYEELTDRLVAAAGL